MEVWGSCRHGRMFPSELYLDLDEVVGPFVPIFPEREQQVDYPMFQKQVEHFVECVRTGRSPHAGGREGLIAMKVVDAVYGAARPVGAI